MQSTQLSKADSRVLAQVFDPESAPTRAEVLVNPDLPVDQHIFGNELLRKLCGRERQAIFVIEDFEKRSEPASNRDQAYKTALGILDGLISEYPDYASARNNRAQLRRWRYGDRNTVCQKKSHLDLGRTVAGLAAVRDLKMSIDLAAPRKPQDGVSPTQGRLLAQSYTQLAALYHAAAKDMDTSEIVDVGNLDGTSWSRDRFEDQASACFYMGGLYGNEVAKALAVQTNPHAKLCGAIVKEAMRTEIAGTWSG